MNVNDYGVAYGFYTAYDMSAYSSVSMSFWSPGLDPETADPTFVATSPDVTVPNTPFVTPGPTFAANQYALYYIKEGDIDKSGTWKVRVTFESAGSPPTVPASRLISAVGDLVVGP